MITHPGGSMALPASSEALPAGFELLPPGSEAIPAGSRGLPAGDQRTDRRTDPNIEIRGRMYCSHEIPQNRVREVLYLLPKSEVRMIVSLASDSPSHVQTEESYI